MDRMPSPTPICTHCGFTWGEYRARGLLGCAACYAAFGEALQGDLLRIHRAVAHEGPEARPENVATDSPSSAPSGEQVAEWREQLADAVRREDYASAARLQKLIRGDLGG
jgi:protein arginine kinase activator